jgi:hypothetical protein
MKYVVVSRSSLELSLIESDDVMSNSESMAVFEAQPDWLIDDVSVSLDVDGNILLNVDTTALERRQRAKRRTSKIDAFQQGQATQIEAELGIPYTDDAGLDYVVLLDMEMNPSKFMRNPPIPGFETAAQIKSWAGKMLIPHRKLAMMRGPARRKLDQDLAEET